MRLDGEGTEIFMALLIPRRFSATTQLLIMKTLTVCVFATTYFSAISAQGQANFTVSRLSYNCTSNLLCLGSAHIFDGTGVNHTTWNSSLVPKGRLSLLPEKRKHAFNSLGVAYYNTSIKLLDKATNELVSFSTDFQVDIVKGLDGDNYPAYIGDGITFVMSADNSAGTLPADFDGAAFGIYNRSLNYTTSIKRIVVEFDTVENSEFPMHDINNNHVSFDFMNITAKAVADAGLVGVDLSQSFHAWVDYWSPTHQLEVRVSNDNQRPASYLLTHSVDLSEAIGEDMWVGFSAGSGGLYSNYYPGDWTFGPYFGTPTSDRRNVILAITVGVSSSILLACIVLSFFVQRMYARRGGIGYWQVRWLRFIGKEDIVIPLEGTIPKSFCYKELSMATKNFSKESMLGQGGSGSVFRGTLQSGTLAGTPVAVKSINKNSHQGKRQFMAEVTIIKKEFKAEVTIITQLRHKNLIKLLGWCEDASQQRYLVVYDLMPNGSLDKALFEPADTTSLSWSQRFNIVKDIAAALEYLHQGYNQQLQVIHRDVKCSNIMLDEEWNAKLGDFGLARLVDHHQRKAATTDMVGTLGYIAPEVVYLHQFTDKTDVYSFGIVVLEVACGRRAVNCPNDEVPVLLDWVWQKVEEDALMSTVDERLEEDYDPYWMQVMLSIGLLCAHPDARCRPPMHHVAQVLNGTAIVPPVPRSKPTVVFRPRSKIFSDGSGKSENTPSSRGSSPPHTSSSNSENAPTPPRSNRGSSPVHALSLVSANTPHSPSHSNQGSSSSITQESLPS